MVKVMVKLDSRSWWNLTRITFTMSFNSSKYLDLHWLYSKTDSYIFRKPCNVVLRQQYSVASIKLWMNPFCLICHLDIFLSNTSRLRSNACRFTKNIELVMVGIVSIFFIRKRHSDDQLKLLTFEPYNFVDQIKRKKSLTEWKLFNKLFNIVGG